MTGWEPTPETRPDDVLAIFTADAAAHPYGIADVVQLWDRSTWWRDGDAVAGVMDLPGSPVPVLYAVSATAPDETLDLLRRLANQLPTRFMATGPRGMSRRLSPRYEPAFTRDYVKMHLDDPSALPPAEPDVVVLTRDDAPALRALFDTDPVAGDFFHDGLLDTGLYLGRWADGMLVAAGGIHVIEAQHSVAAIGNVTTHPAHRRRGHGAAVMGTLCRRLLEQVSVVGLNVREANVSARSLYQRLGFRTVLPYEEAELAQR